MSAWEQEKASDDRKKRVETSERLTKERIDLKRKAHAARQDLARAQKVETAILLGARVYESLSLVERNLLDDFNSGKLHRVHDECDAAFGWNKEKRDAALSAAQRIPGAAQQGLA